MGEENSTVSQRLVVTSSKTEQTTKNNLDSAALSDEIALICYSQSLSKQLKLY